MDKYTSINKIVMKVTDDEALRTFFTLYLAEDDECKRDALDDQFWAAIDILPENERLLMRGKFAACFQKLPLAVADWGKDVETFITKHSPKIAA